MYQVIKVTWLLANGSSLPSSRFRSGLGSYVSTSDGPPPSQKMIRLSPANREERASEPKPTADRFKSARLKAIVLLPLCMTP